MDAQSLRPLPKRGLALLTALILGGLILRLCAARGGLWIDEAWSVLYANQATPFLGVFSQIHHDNNHHLNTLWLQLVGMGAPSFLMRGLSIVTSTATIGVVAMISLRRGVTASLATAAIFALSPILVLYGSEARGYAPMLFCLSLAVWLALDWRDAPEAELRTGQLALVTTLGAFSHLMMAPAIFLIAAWGWLSVRVRFGAVGSVKRSAAMFGLPVFAVLCVAGVILGSAQLVAGGLQVGSSTPFTWDLFNGALGELATLSSGLGAYGAFGLWGLAAIAMLVVARSRQIPLLYLVLILGLPIAVALLHPGNSQFARYYLVSAFGLLMLAGDRIGALIRDGGWRRWLGAAALSAILGGSALQDRALIAIGRGHNERAVEAMMKIKPRSATVLLAHERAQAILKVAAAQHSYDIKTHAGSCIPADFLFVERDRGVPVGDAVVRCRIAWRVIASDDAAGPSGQDWTLYAPIPLPHD
jgi:hypothetical protein